MEVGNEMDAAVMVLTASQTTASQPTPSEEQIYTMATLSTTTIFLSERHNLLYLSVMPWPFNSLPLNGSRVKGMDKGMFKATQDPYVM